MALVEGQSGVDRRVGPALTADASSESQNVGDATHLVPPTPRPTTQTPPPQPRETHPNPTDDTPPASALAKYMRSSSPASFLLSRIAKYSADNIEYVEIKLTSWSHATKYCHTSWLRSNSSHVETYRAWPSKSHPEVHRDSMATRISQLPRKGNAICLWRKLNDRPMRHS